MTEALYFLEMSEEKEYCVYKHTSPSGKVYIGLTCQSLQKRWMNGRGYKHCPVMAKAIAKYGWENFTHEVLETGLTKQEAEMLERQLIRAYNSTDRRFGYNVDYGGNCTGTHSEETKRKISEGNKGKKLTPEQCKAMSEAKKGKLTGADNPFYGRHHTESVRKAQSEMMKGNEFFKGKHHSEEFKKMKSQQMKEKYGNGKHPQCMPVEHEEDGVVETYSSISEAARQLKVSTSTIHKYVYNENNKNWRFINEKRT